MKFGGAVVVIFWDGLFDFDSISRSFRALKFSIEIFMLFWHFC